MAVLRDLAAAVAAIAFAIGGPFWAETICFLFQ